MCLGLQVLRDECVESGGWAWAEPGQEGRSQEWGSGYPSDPKTVEWMKTNTDMVFGYPSVIRFSWAPVRNLLKDQVARAPLRFSLARAPACLPASRGTSLA